MALMTRQPAQAATASLAALTASQSATITMLRSCGHITERDAVRLSEKPAALDDLVVLVMLHLRRDITVVEYEFEKDERLRASH
jgi:hypothetical protein